MEGGNTVEEKHFMVGSDLASDGRPRRQDQVMRRTYPPIPPLQSRGMTIDSYFQLLTSSCCL
jgi:hypothetical protein